MKNVPLIIRIAILWIIFGAAPILFSWPPLPTIFYFGAHPVTQLLGKALLLILLLAAAKFIWRHDAAGGREKVIRYAGFALLAALLTDLHYNTVDVACIGWQLDQYGGILLHTYLPPDQSRFLSQGTLWWMLLTNSDFLFSYLMFRFFFTFVLCLSIYRLARCYLSTPNSVAVVFLYAAFYPLSTRYYFGNLLDPMSHLVMFTALYYCRQGRFWSFFWLFILGVFIKETTLLLAPCYYLLNLENAKLREQQNLQRMVLLGVTGMMVFFACRLPFHFNYDFNSLNRTPESMIYANLGIGHAKVGSVVPVWLRYMHPVLFLFMWVPVIVWGRRRLPASLFWTSLYLAATLYVTNTLFGWNYESRNFVPGLVVLVIATLIVLADWVAEKPALVARQK